MSYLVVSADLDAVVSEDVDLTAAVVSAIDRGWTVGYITNQDGATADLTEWVEENGLRIEEWRRIRAEIEEEVKEEWQIMDDYR